jgi:hypothetical protein
MQRSRQQLLTEFARGVELEGDVRAEVIPHDLSRGSGRLVLRWGPARAELRAAALLVPYPSGLRRLVEEDPGVEVVLVERVPPGLEAAARGLGVGYLDRAGHGRIVTPGFVYVVEPSSSGPPASTRTSPFAPKASRVVRAILADVRPWRLTELAVRVGLNPGNVHRALGALVEAGYVERDEELYVATDPGSLLEAWAEQAAPSRWGTNAPINMPLEEAARRLVAAGPGLTISGELAAEFLAPHLPSSTATLHCPNADVYEEIVAGPLAELSIAANHGFGRVFVDVADEGVSDFGAHTRGLPLVHPVQVYVDLARTQTRAREAAEHLRRERIGF